jgi:hypothetical protein
LKGAKNKRIMSYTFIALSIGTGIASYYTANPMLAIIAVQGILTNLNTLLDIFQLIDELERKLEKANRHLQSYQQYKKCKAIRKNWRKKISKKIKPKIRKKRRKRKGKNYINGW